MQEFGAAKEVGGSGQRTRAHSHVFDMLAMHMHMLFVYVGHCVKCVLVYYLIVAHKHTSTRWSRARKSIIVNGLHPATTPPPPKHVARQSTGPERGKGQQCVEDLFHAIADRTQRHYILIRTTTPTPTIQGVSERTNTQKPASFSRISRKRIWRPDTQTRS